MLYYRRISIRKAVVASKILLTQFPIRLLVSQSSNIVIVGAVRTPFIRSHQDVSGLSVNRLSKLAIEAVLKRATLPKESIYGLHLVIPNEDFEIGSITSGLLSNVKCKNFEDDSQAIQTAFEELQSNQSKSVIIAGVETLPAFKFSNEAIHRLKTDLNGSYDAEIFPVTLIQKPRKVLTLTQDDYEVRIENSPLMIATALALMTNDYANNLKIKPLAHFMGSTCFHSKHEQPIIIRKLFDECRLNLNDVCQWEVDVASADDLALSLGLNRHFFCTNSITRLFNQSMKNSASLQFTHLANSLKPRKFGCAVVTRLEDGLQKVFLLENTNTSVSPPLLTLFTIDHLCPLCDSLMEELENNFSNEYQLEKIFIDRKENVRFLRLYRHDIPVLFLNGQFLCMHRLKPKLLRKKLDELKML